MVTPAHACSYVFIVLTPAQHNLVGDNHFSDSYKIHIYLWYLPIVPQNVPPYGTPVKNGEGDVHLNAASSEHGH